jgi:hypothetical protein
MGDVELPRLFRVSELFSQPATQTLGPCNSVDPSFGGPPTLSAWEHPNHGPRLQPLRPSIDVNSDRVSVSEHDCRVHSDYSGEP